MKDALPNNVGVFKDVGGGLGLVSRKGNPGPRGNILFYDDMTLNDLGQVSFEAFAGGYAHISEGSGVLAPGIVAGEPAPVGDGTTISKFIVLGEPAFDGQGTMVAQALMALDGDIVTFKSDTGIWRKPASGPLELVVREGNPIQALPGATYANVGPRVVTNNNGDIAFWTVLLPAAGGGGDGILAGQPGNLQVVALKRGAAPEPDGAAFLTFVAESINDAGKVAFKAWLTRGSGPTVTTDRDRGLYTTSNGEIERVVREGDPLPGCGPSDGTVFSSFEDIFIADNGDVYFRAFLSGSLVSSSNDGSIWQWKAASRDLLLFAREGDRAPSTDSVFESLLDFSVSNGGVVAFTGLLLPGVGDVTEGNDFGVWMDRGDLDVPELVLREGDVVDLGGDNLADLFLLQLDPTTNAFGGNGGHGKVVNDMGELIGRAVYGVSEFTLNPEWVEGDPISERYTKESIGGNSGVFILAP
jgi:hypothetical protein